MSILTLILLALVQGLAELLPVSSSGHVILVQTWLGLDPSTPEMSFLLVMLHLGTMFAVLLYFWKRWRAYFSNRVQGIQYVKKVIIATLVTGALGLGLKFIIEKVILEEILHFPKGEIEQLFKMLPLLSACLFIAGLFIFLAGRRKQPSLLDGSNSISTKTTLELGLIQGLVLPFRGLSRSGMTISMALLRNVSQREAEDFSFALAVALTPAVLYHELKRFLLAKAESGANLSDLLLPSCLGMFFAFLGGLIALRWLSSWLEKGKWHYFGIYCWFFAGVVLLTYFLKL